MEDLTTTATRPQQPPPTTITSATATTTTNKFSSWPPVSFHGVNVEQVVNYCEQIEVTPSMSVMMDRSLVPHVHMAALLYLGETVHARHLWRRTSERDEMLSDWWQVAKAMLQGQETDIALKKCAQNHPEPLRTYAMDIAARPNRKPPIQQYELNEDVVAFLETKKWNM